MTGVQTCALPIFVLRQKETFGEIVVRKHKMFDVVFQSEEPMMAVDEGYV